MFSEVGKKYPGIAANEKAGRVPKITERERPIQTVNLSDKPKGTIVDCVDKNGTKLRLEVLDKEGKTRPQIDIGRIVKDGNLVDNIITVDEPIYFGGSDTPYFPTHISVITPEKNDNEKAN